MQEVAGAIGYLVNARGVLLECTRVLLETLLVRFLMHGSERSRIRAVHRDNLGCFMGIRRIDKVLNTGKGGGWTNEEDGRKD